MNLETPSSGAVFIARLEDTQGNLLSHRIFATAEEAASHVTSSPVHFGQHYRILVREAVPAAIDKLKQHGMV